MESLIIFGLGFWLGWWIQGIVMKALIRSAMKDIGIDPKEFQRQFKAAMQEAQAQKTEVLVKVEKQGNQFYAYEHPSDRFLGQHAETQELYKIIANHYPTGTTVTIPKELGAELFNDKTVA